MISKEDLDIILSYVNDTVNAIFNDYGQSTIELAAFEQEYMKLYAANELVDGSPKIDHSLFRRFLHIITPLVETAQTGGMTKQEIKDYLSEYIRTLHLQGNAGASAYEIAVNNGFQGTEAEWLASLHGADGHDGIDGVDGQNGVNGVNGANGESAYEIAVGNGFAGTEQEWLLSLKGEKGDKGDKGEKGQDGSDADTSNCVKGISLKEYWTTSPKPLDKDEEGQVLIDLSELSRSIEEREERHYQIYINIYDPATDSHAQEGVSYVPADFTQTPVGARLLSPSSNIELWNWDDFMESLNLIDTWTIQGEELADIRVPVGDGHTRAYRGSFSYLPTSDGYRFAVMFESDGRLYTFYRDKVNEEYGSWYLRVEQYAKTIDIPTNLSELEDDLGSGALHSHTKSQIRDFAHSHEISEVNGLESALAAKQDTIDDLSDIRTGAELGATALQEHQDLSNYKTKQATVSKPSTISGTSDVVVKGVTQNANGEINVEYARLLSGYPDITHIESDNGLKYRPTPYEFCIFANNSQAAEDLNQQLKSDGWISLLSNRSALTNAITSSWNAEWVVLAGQESMVGVYPAKVVIPSGDTQKYITAIDSDILGASFNTDLYGYFVVETAIYGYLYLFGCNFYIQIDFSNNGGGYSQIKKIANPFSALTSKPTTLAGYGITDAKIENGVVTLGSTSIAIPTASGGDVNVIETVKVNGTELTPDANKAVDIIVPTQEELDNKADKVENATEGHLAGLDENGKLTDSGIAAADVLLNSKFNNHVVNSKTAIVSGSQLGSNNNIYDYLIKCKLNGKSLHAASMQDFGKVVFSNPCHFIWDLTNSRSTEVFPCIAFARGANGFLLLQVDIEGNKNKGTYHIGIMCDPPAGTTWICVTDIPFDILPMCSNDGNSDGSLWAFLKIPSSFSGTITATPIRVWSVNGFGPSSKDNDVNRNYSISNSNQGFQDDANIQMNYYTPDSLSYLKEIGTQAFTDEHLATPYGKYGVDLFYDSELNENDIVSDNVINDFLLHQMSGEIKSLERRLAALEGIINAN